MPDGIPLINGKGYDYGSVIFMWFGLPAIGITKISYSKKQDKQLVYGAGRNPIQYGYGKIEYAGSIEVTRDEWQRIINASPNKDPLLISPFPIKVVFGDVGTPVQTDTLQNVVFAEDPFDGNSGDTSLKCTIPLVFAGLKHE